jgi:hypothetical protein
MHDPTILCLIYIGVEYYIFDAIVEMNFHGVKFIGKKAEPFNVRMETAAIALL